MTSEDPLGLGSDPKNVSLNVDIDEMLSIRKPFPTDELHSYDFTTYDDVHKLLIDNPQFTDQNMLDLIDKVDQGDELSGIQMTSMIRKAWAIRTT